MAVVSPDIWYCTWEHTDRDDFPYAVTFQSPDEPIRTIAYCEDKESVKMLQSALADFCARLNRPPPT